MLIGGSLGLTTINTFFEGTFSRAMGDNPNMVDQIFSVGVLAFILAIVILLKDIIDGGTFAPSERRSALLGFGLAGLLVLSALTMSMISSDTVNQNYADDPIKSVSWVGANTLTVSHFYEDMDIAVSQNSQTANYIRLYINYSIVTHDSLQTWREISFNVSDQVIQVGLLQSVTNTVVITDSQFTKTYDATAGVTKINASLSAVEAMALQSSTNGVNDIYFEFKFQNSIQKSLLIEWDLEVENEAELANFLIWAVMSFALYIPLMIYLDAFNNVRRFVNNPFGNNRRRMRRMRR